MDKILLVDGHNLLFQMFFGMPSRFTNKDGVPIHAVVGFVGALNKILDMTNPTHVAVLFDGETPSERKKMLAEYKANRVDYSQVEACDNPFSQLPLVYKALDFWGISHTETSGAETDDIIASYVKQHAKSSQIVIASFDSDYFQLVQKNVFVLRYRGTKSVLCDEQFVAQKYGVSPCNFAHFKCLVGDTSDNIKGLVGVGPKTAQKLLQGFKTLQNIVDGVQSIQSERLRRTISDGKNTLLTNEKLILLDGNFPLPFALSEMVAPPRKKTMEIVAGIGL